MLLQCVEWKSKRDQNSPEWLKLGNHMSQTHFWTLFSDAPTPQCMKTIVSAIPGSPTNLLSSAGTAFSWKCYSVPSRTCLPFSFFPSSLPPAQQQPKMLQCLQKQEGKDKDDLGPKLSCGEGGFQGSICCSDIVVCLNLPLAFLGAS